jgi:guanyl-specific ribonuclease Sa
LNLFTQSDAVRALELADEAVRLARRIIEGGPA